MAPKKKTAPKFQSYANIVRRYYQWLIRRENKKMQAAHFVGKRPSRTTQA